MSQSNTQHALEREYGRALTAKDVADFFRIDPRTVKKYATDLGGVWIFGRLMFFENRIREAIDAIQSDQKQQGKMVGVRQKARRTQATAIQHTKRSPRLGSADASGVGRGERADPHGILGGLGDKVS